MNKWVCRYFVFLVLRCSDHLSHILMDSMQTISREQFPLDSGAEEGLNFIKEWLRFACMEKTSQVVCEHDFCTVRRAEVGGWGLALQESRSSCMQFCDSPVSSWKAVLRVVPNVKTPSFPLWVSCSQSVSFFSQVAFYGEYPNNFISEQIRGKISFFSSLWRK